MFNSSNSSLILRYQLSKKLCHTSFHKAHIVQMWLYILSNSKASILVRVEDLFSFIFDASSISLVNHNAYAIALSHAIS